MTLAVTECHSLFLRIQALKHDFEHLAIYKVGAGRTVFPLLWEGLSELRWCRHPLIPLIFLFVSNTLPTGGSDGTPVQKGKLKVENLSKYSRGRKTTPREEVFLSLCILNFPTALPRHGHASFRFLTSKFY